MPSSSPSNSDSTPFTPLEGSASPGDQNSTAFRKARACCIFASLAILILCGFFLLSVWFDSLLAGAIERSNYFIASLELVPTSSDDIVLLANATFVVHDSPPFGLQATLRLLPFVGVLQINGEPLGSVQMPSLEMSSAVSSASFVGIQITVTVASDPLFTQFLQDCFNNETVSAHLIGEAEVSVTLTDLSLHLTGKAHFDKELRAQGPSFLSLMIHV